MTDDVKRILSGITRFWNGLRDDAHGGFYGLVHFDLAVDRQADKGVILHSRILWFYSNLYLVTNDPDALAYAEHAYRFLRGFCFDNENGGVFWSVAFDGQIKDDTKHTYNQAFAIYALSSYYAAAKDESARELAAGLFNLVEEKAFDGVGYRESFNRDFTPSVNDKLSENGIIADKTMNTLLHLAEAYTEYVKVTGDERVRASLARILNIVAGKVYNPALTRQEVFFDNEMNTILDLHSYGHDIEASWLLDRAADYAGDAELRAKIYKIDTALARNILNTAFQGGSVWNEREKGVNDKTRVWWVQAEAALGFYNAWQKSGDEAFLSASRAVLGYIQEKVIDKREGGEWFWSVDDDGKPTEKPIVEPWKCPYHNGRMCFELITRAEGKHE